jgi:hypothetical protein
MVGEGAIAELAGSASELHTKSGFFRATAAALSSGARSRLVP